MTQPIKAAPARILRRIVLFLSPRPDGRRAGMPALRRLPEFTAALFILFACGCSSFNRDWRKAASTPAPANGIEGRWQGSWLSAVNRHQGRLRCLMSRIDDGHYQARFHARYARIFSFSYSVPLRVDEHNGLFKYQGAEDLGRLAGGKYQYEGSATATNFFSTYRSQHDRGTFQMARP